MKRKVIELVLLATSLALSGSFAPAQTPPAEPAPTEAPKSGTNTTAVRGGAAFLLILVIAVIVIRRKKKAKTDDEF